MKICKEYRECCDPNQDLQPWKGKLGIYSTVGLTKLVFCKHCGQMFYDLRPDFGFKELTLNISGTFA